VYWVRSRGLERSGLQLDCIKSQWRERLAENQVSLASSFVITGGETHSQAVDEKVLPRPQANNSQQSRGGILLTGLVVSLCGAAGPQERIGGGEVELARGLRQNGPCRRERKRKGFREVSKKRRGTNASLYVAELRTGRCG
jgi:hypothetical protein